MAEKAAKPGGIKRTLYRVEGARFERLRAHCPKCGPGTFLAKHADRVSCGRCGYTEFAK